MINRKKRLEILEMVKTGELSGQEALQEIKNYAKSTVDDNGSSIVDKGGFVIDNSESTIKNGGNGKREYSPTISSSDLLLKKVMEDVSHIVAIILRMDNADVVIHDEMTDLGFDSFSYTELADQVNSLYGTDVTAALFFEYTTIGALLNYLVKEHHDKLMDYYRVSFLSPEVDVIVPEVQTPVKKKKRQRFEKKQGYLIKMQKYEPVKNSPIAIIGMSGVLPQSPNLDVFWEYLLAGKNLITEIPADRWDWREFFGDPVKEPNKTYARWGGFMPDIDKFDARFFGISNHEAELMDPQQRIFLQIVWNTIEDAGYKPSDFFDTKTGVFVGAAMSDYIELMTAHHSEIKAHTGTGMFHSVLANRISYMLNIHGPSKPVDTACSSSLVAIHRAVDSILAGQCDMAIAGGVNVLLTPKLFISFSKAGMLSREGRCKSFDASADGYVRGEGVGALLLKPLEAAERDGDHIYAVILGTSENHSGKSKSLTSPNPVAQANVIIDAYTKANIDPRTITYIEAQGTGTNIGDPVEINGLKKAFAALYDRWGMKPGNDPHCGVGTVKTNIGHLEIAAGIAGMFRVLLSMKYKKITGLINFNRLNPGIKLENSPFYIVDTTQEWKAIHDENGRCIPRRAGVSAFGFGGSNAHIVLEEYRQESMDTKKAGPPYIIVLSAKEEESLKKSAENLSFCIKNNQTFTECDDDRDFLTKASYTFQVGREAFETRLALVVDSKEELLNKLEAYTQGKEGIAGLFTGYCDKNKKKSSTLLDDEDRRQIVQRALADKNFTKLVQLWINGFDVDWRLLYTQTENKPSRLSLPGYSFKKTRYWIPEAEDILSKYSAAGGPGKWDLHPLVMENVSTLNEQRFRSVFYGNEFFLKDYIVFDEKVLPGVAGLEMIRAAGGFAGEERVSVIENVIWMSPVVMENSALELYTGVYPGHEGVEVEIYSVKGNEFKVHTKGIVRFPDAAPEEETNRIDIPAIKDRCKELLDNSICYLLYKATGLSYGPGFQGVREIVYGENEALARIELPAHLEKGWEHYMIHPAIADAAMQGIAGVMHKVLEKEKKPFVPFSVAKVIVLKKPEKTCYAYITVPEEYRKQEEFTPIFDISIIDEEGNSCIIFKRFVFRALSRKQVVSKPGPAHDVTFYTTKWMQSEGTRGNQEVKGNVLVLDFDTELGNSLKEIAADTGTGEVLTVVPNDQVRKLDEEVNEVNIANQADYAAFFKELKEKNRFPRYIIHNLSYDLFIEDKKSLELHLERGIYSLLYIAQALIAGKLNHPVDLYFIHPGSEKNIQPQYEACTGFFKTLAKENPKLRFKSIAFDGIPGKKTASFIKNELLLAGSEDKEVLYQDGKRYVRMAGFIDPAELKQDDLHLKDDGAYLITGGLGGLGLIFARHIAGSCKAGIVLTGRSDLTPATQKRLDELSEAGNKILYIKADMSNQDDVTKCIETIKREFGHLHGILHAAGVIRDSFTLKKTKEELDAVSGPKVFGTLFLDVATKKEKLDFIILFSSISAITGNAGQGDYAFANSFMDNFARWRNILAASGERSGKTISVNWPLWQEGGMKVDEASASYLFNTSGITPLPTEKGLAAFSELLRLDLAQVGVFTGDVERFAAQLRIPAPERVISVTETVPGEKQPVLKQVRKIKKKVSKAPKDLLLKIENTILMICAKILKVNENELDKESEFADFGLDSILMIKLMNQVEETFRITVEPNSVTQYPTIKSFSRYLVEEGLVKEAGGDAGEEEFEVAEEVVQEKEQPVMSQGKNRLQRRPRFAGNYQSGQTFRKIAVTGMACRFPESPDLEAFWNNLKKGRDCISVVPPERWDAEEFFSPDKNAPLKSYSKWAGFIDNIDAFDAGFFGISDDDALVMDPQHRILLELTQELFDRAGYTKADVSGSKTGVFLGGNEGRYVQNHVDMIPDHLMKRFMVNKIQNMMAARISDYYNLKGTSLVIDTACSSALVALHQACKSIMNGECDQAITGGIEILVDPYEHIGFSKSGALSDGPYSFVFDERANGFVLGEGAGLVLVKDYENALRDGDQIFGIILGSAVNNDGKTMGLTVPSQDGQKDVIQQAITASGINPDTISLYEAHGTGTLLGDPIEIKAATSVYRQYTDEKQFCAVGSVKSNVGHLLRAAGIVGIIKLLLALQHKQIPPTLNCERPHPRFRFDESPFFPVTEMEEWTPRKGVRRAAISSFGFGGTNCHIVLEGFDASTVEFYRQNRNRLPVTVFNRKRFWLGEEIVEFGVVEETTDEEAVLEQDVEDDEVAADVEEVVMEQVSDEVEQKVEDEGMDDEAYRELLVKLQNGEITPEELMKLKGEE